MHEMSLAEGILAIIIDTARRESFRSVRSVRLEIGQLAGVEVDALRTAFEVVVRGSLAEGATLEIDRVAGQAWCPDCGRTVPLASRVDPCPHCGEWRLQVSGGTQMRVVDLQVS